MSMAETNQHVLVRIGRIEYDRWVRIQYAVWVYIQYAVWRARMIQNETVFTLLQSRIIPFFDS